MCCVSQGSTWSSNAPLKVSQVLWCFTKGAGACLGCGSGCEHKALEVMQRHLCHSKCAWELLQGVFGVSQPECHQSLTHCVVNLHTKRSMDGELLPAGFCVRAGSCHPCSYPQLPLAVYGLSFHVYRIGMLCDRQSSSTGDLQSVPELQTRGRSCGCFHRFSHGAKAPERGADTGTALRWL